MPNPSQTIEIRRTHRAYALHSPLSKLGVLIAMLVSILMILVVLVGVWFYFNLTRNLHSVDSLASLLEPPNGTLLHHTVLYDRTRTHVIMTLVNPSAAGEQYLRVWNYSQGVENQVSMYLVYTTVAELDPDFWDHRGFSLSEIIKDTPPTLAQQLVSNTILIDEPPSAWRDMRERILAAQVIQKFGNRKVMEWYLNSAQYGEFIYGADAAAHVYFGKSATQLSLAEAAMLTAIAESPSISPLSIPQLLKQQQELIIQKMLIGEMITDDVAAEAINEDIQFREWVDAQSLAPGFTNLVLSQLSSTIPLGRIWRGGYEIVTSLDYDLQVQSMCATQAQLNRLQGMAETPVTVDGNACTAKDFLPSSQNEVVYSTGGLLAEVIILDPQTGEILAWVGGDEAGINQAKLAQHPAGTILSPFLYLTAFNLGKSPATLLWDLPGVSGDNASTPQENGSVEVQFSSFHGPVSLRDAFANDYVGASAAMLQQVGAENVWQTEKLFGIEAPGITPGASVRLDDFYSQQISLLDITRAYGVFANQGVMSGQSTGSVPGIAYDRIAPVAILSVSDTNDRIVMAWGQREGIPIVSQPVAYLVTNVLSDAEARQATIGRPSGLEIGRPSAAKVSMVNQASSSWTVGYVPQLAVGVWMGNLQGGTGEISSDMSIGLWHAVMQYSISELPTQELSQPGSIVRAQVCKPSGLLVTPLCQSITDEVFLAGNQPTQTDNLYQKFLIDRQTGLLATIFTSRADVEEKIYLVVPPEVTPWAIGTGLPIPPAEYDEIPNPSAYSASVNFSEPRMLAHLSGLIKIIGSASGEDFSYYRIQVGQGQNPQRWIQIGENNDNPVSEGLLGTWDTAGLNGVYVLQLMVVRQDLRVDSAYLQVTIDNTSPEVKILSPRDDQQAGNQQNESVFMNVIATDNQAVDRVDFYVDGDLVRSVDKPPFAILWDALPGKHVLDVTAYDLTGNKSEKAVTFSVTR